MTATPIALQPLSFPLYGSRLIEASAGTGKTYAIAALYLRLVLGHGGENAFPQALLPTQILVTTFTNAAASELRDRIRARLVEAAATLRGDAGGDDLLQALRASIPEGDWQDNAQRLELAAEWMDEAVISTIHGWCQRMLGEHAFDSLSLFNLTLQTDERELLAEATRDYWRVQCYPLQGGALDWVIQNWKTPDALCNAFGTLLAESDAPVDTPLKTLLEAELKARAQTLEVLKAPWAAWANELESLLDAAVDAGQVDNRKIQARYYRPWLQKLRGWHASSEASLDLGAGFTRLTPEGLSEAWKGNADQLPQHPALSAMRTLPQQLAALPDPAEAALRHAAAWVRHRFTGEKLKRAEIGFDDMLIRLDDALQGEGGDRLAEVIRQQFPVAMIDEFQDTDPLQYRIFDRIYKVAAEPPAPDGAPSPTRGAGSSGLFIIGDPKQAIYSFRGADIHTYLRARHATEGRHYSLAKNFRSSKHMVAAVNQLFAQAEARDGKGAFGFRTEAGNDLPFIEVDAQGRDEVWTLENAAQTALTVWHWQTEKPVGKGAYINAMATCAAEEIARLLNLGQQNRAGFVRDEQLTALRPSDIAVLVRGWDEAKAIREQLSRRGVQSVYLSDRDSVFDSQEARDLRLWLLAAAAPENDRALRAALASRTLNLDLCELETLNRDEQQWEARILQFRDYQHCWRKQGVLPMLRRLLHAFNLPAKLNERALTNLLHLSELLQHAAAELDGEQALIRHLDEHLAGNQPGEEQVLRLESDAALVRVVTIHKAKGLEYPLVFLPFICTFRPLEGGKPFVMQENDQRRTVFHADEASLARADAERLGEDLRRFYVALTRARHACWLGVADLNYKNGLGQAALGYLLDVPNTPLTEALNRLQDAPRIAVQAVTEPEGETHYQAADNAPVTLACRQPQRRAAAENYWIASYSALRAEADAPHALRRSAPPPSEREAQTGSLPEGAAPQGLRAWVSTPRPRHDDAAPETPAMQNASDDDRIPQPSPVARPLSPEGIHAFPRGANPGTFLHGLLEVAAAEGFADTKTLRKQIARRCQRRGQKQWINPLTDWLLALLQQPLPLPSNGGGTVRLADLKCYQPEMEFWFETHHVDASKLDHLVQQYECPNQPRPARGVGDRLNGMFKGFIDLTFEYGGRYYVADYKSNWLGENDAAYTPDALRCAMLEHRYDLQYTLYLLALHRQLKLRLPDYDYDRHMGGALYLFLRAQAEGVYLARPPRALIERLDKLFKGEQEEMQHE